MLLTVGCTNAAPRPTSPPSPGVTPGPSPSPSGTLSAALLKYRLLAELGPISWCDPDFYPIQVQDEQVSANEHWAEITADEPTYRAIAGHLGLDPDADPSTLDDAERLAVYRDWKLLNAVLLEPGAGGFAFDLITETNPGLGEGVRTAGTIDAGGTIDVALQERSGLAACPICLARGTRIATPSGDVAVESLRVGDLVWTLDEHGRRVAQPLVRVGSTAVPASHEVVHVVLDDGREAWISPGHPTADGRTLGALRAGDELDGARIVSVDRVAYQGGATFDLLPAGVTATYWANGILLGSTLR